MAARIQSPLPTLPQKAVAGKCVAPCTACGLMIWHSKTTGNKQPGALGFRIEGCRRCGHLMRRVRSNKLVDLTKDEAARLAAHPDFKRVRQVVDDAIRHLMG